jgi:hypothetical protein
MHTATPPAATLADLVAAFPAGALVDADQHTSVPHVSPQVAAAGRQAINLAAQRDADRQPAAGSGNG